MRRVAQLAAVLLSIFPAQTGHCSQENPAPTRLEQAVQTATSQRLHYGASWTPPGHSSPMRMDCSNAARWILREVSGLEIPRTASEQYLFFRKRGLFVKVRPDPRRLMKILRPGDLLFWEHSYRPTRKPPVTHVMVYLGKDSSGKMWMFGAQSSRGTDVYRFVPEQTIGSYRWFLWFRRESRFIGYARP